MVADSSLKLRLFILINFLNSSEFICTDLESNTVIKSHGVN